MSRRFVNARDLAEQTGIPYHSLTAMVRAQHFTSMRPSRRVLLIDVVEFQEYLKSTITPKRVSE